MRGDFIWNNPIRLFWSVRDQQTRKQLEAGAQDAGTRGSVTGGKHLDPLTDAVAELFQRDPRVQVEIRRGRGISLPGYYRRTKVWDLVVLYRGALVAAIELKSQVGSFGNNFNNRTEEAIGNAVDIWRAHEEGLFGDVRPWLGFIMVAEKVRGSTEPLRDSATIFPSDPVFSSTGYLDRYRILMRRLVQDRLYDAAVVVAVTRGEPIEEPDPDLSFANFESAVAARLAYIWGLPDSAFPLEGPSSN